MHYLARNIHALLDFIQLDFFWKINFMSHICTCPISCQNPTPPLTTHQRHQGANEDALTLVGLGRACQELGRYDSAKQCFDRVCCSGQDGGD